MQVLRVLRQFPERKGRMHSICEHVTRQKIHSKKGRSTDETKLAANVSRIDSIKSLPLWLRADADSPSWLCLGRAGGRPSRDVIISILDECACECL
jgi:hypothetical protein